MFDKKNPESPCIGVANITSSWVTWINTIMPRAKMFINTLHISWKISIYAYQKN